MADLASQFTQTVPGVTVGDLASFSDVTGDIQDSGVSAAAVSAALSTPGALPFVHGQAYPAATLGTILTVLGDLYATPIFIPNKCVMQAIGISVTTGQTGGGARLGLYADNGSGAPGSLVAGTDSGTLVATSTAVESTSSLAVTLTPGWYWLASQFTASSTMPTVEGITAIATNEPAKRLGFSSITNALAGSAEFASGVYVTGQTYGAMPATFPTITGNIVNATCPLPAIQV